MREKMIQLIVHMCSTHTHPTCKSVHSRGCMFCTKATAKATEKEKEKKKRDKKKEYIYIKKNRDNTLCQHHGLTILGERVQ